MESFGAFLDAEMGSLSQMFSTEETEFLLDLNVSNILSNHVQVPSSFLAENMAKMDVDGIFLTTDTDFGHFPQESAKCSEYDNVFLLDRGYLSFHDNDASLLNDQSIELSPTNCENESLKVPLFADDRMMEDFLQLRNAQAMVTGDSYEQLQLKRKYEESTIQIDQDNGYQLRSLEDYSSQSPKKKSRVSNDTRQNKKNKHSKQNKKVVPVSIDTEEENNTSVTNGRTSSNLSSEEDSNASQEQDGVSISDLKSSKGKERANRGTATDPQSLYARRRRERINERLRILQNIVPNGTKVDISTMLEEAVHYVKFLQLQIKLLSSDELWMYAPIAYNGMNIGLYDSISPNLWS